MTASAADDRSFEGVALVALLVDHRDLETVGNRFDGSGSPGKTIIGWQYHLGQQELFCYPVFVVKADQVYTCSWMSLQEAMEELNESIRDYSRENAERGGMELDSPVQPAARATW
ncbi:hypothetical protein ACFL6C_06600 [Myxococcota bacterium]